ncbi:MAG: prepilin-type N-terminal cleavage/methylation domain-containing protein [Fibrobacterota bacterium]|nr:prepilin-type N-terminal cleavage/methylation domain-containing protein [Fibrobacterota bacterium]QQS05682.1 MAG: prepilin-type N-terminal cleavage/methylation domain-containing protein [Fibrobacterota bacterium]
MPAFHGILSRLGFTLIEMLIVLAIVGILTTMTAMGWTKVMNRISGKGAAYQVRDALTSARMDALTRKRHSGVRLDPSGLRFQLFVDSSGTGANGRYDSGETILHPWETLPSQPSFASISSSVSPDPTPRSCKQAAAPAISSSQSGVYSIVFRPDGRSWAGFQAKLVPKGSTDTVRIGVLPSTGLITLEH